MEREINQRMAALAHSEIRAMTQACIKVKGINMAQGVCDTPVPPVVLKGAEQAMESGKNVYTRFDGLAELRQALAAKLARYNGSRRTQKPKSRSVLGRQVHFIVSAWPS